MDVPSEMQEVGMKIEEICSQFGSVKMTLSNRRVDSMRKLRKRFGFRACSQ